MRKKGGENLIINEGRAEKEYLIHGIWSDDKNRATFSR